MTERNNRLPFKKAFEKSLDLLGEPSKRSLLHYLEREFNISFAENRSPRLVEVESALRFIFGKGANIIIDELHRSLGQPERPYGKRPVATRHGKNLA